MSSWLFFFLSFCFLFCIYAFLFLGLLEMCSWIYLLPFILKKHKSQPDELEMQNTESEIGASSLGRTQIRWTCWKPGVTNNTTAVAACGVNSRGKTSTVCHGFRVIELSWKDHQNSSFLDRPNSISRIFAGELKAEVAVISRINIILSCFSFTLWVKKRYTNHLVVTNPPGVYLAVSKQGTQGEVRFYFFLPLYKCICIVGCSGYQ